MRTLVSAVEAIDKGMDPNKAGGGDQSKEAKAMASNVSSFLGWAMSSITLAAASSGALTGATPQKERSSAGAAATPAANGASARRDLAAGGAWDGGAANGAAAPRAPPPLVGELSASGRLAGDVDTSSLDKLAGACSSRLLFSFVHSAWRLALMHVPCTHTRALHLCTCLALAELRGALAVLKLVCSARSDYFLCFADDAWGGSDDWGDLEVPAPAQSQTPTKAKPKPKLVVSKKRDGKGD